LADVSRWRMREAVAMALQPLLRHHPQKTLARLKTWIADEHWLAIRHGGACRSADTPADPPTGAGGRGPADGVVSHAAPGARLLHQCGGYRNAEGGICPAARIGRGARPGRAMDCAGEPEEAAAGPRGSATGRSPGPSGYAFRGCN